MSCEIESGLECCSTEHVIFDGVPYVDWWMDTTELGTVTRVLIPETDYERAVRLDINLAFPIDTLEEVEEFLQDVGIPYVCEELEISYSVMSRTSWPEDIVSCGDKADGG